MGRQSGNGGGVAKATLDRFLARQKLVPDTANSFYIVALAWLSGRTMSYHFQRNIGGSDVTDTGGTWPIWRLTGVAELASFDTLPSNPLYVYSEDIGAQDYALSFTGNGLFAGSYHGGEVLVASGVEVDGRLVDPRVASSGLSYRIWHSSTVTSGGNSYAVDYFSVTTNPYTAGLTFALNGMTSAAAFNRVFIGMVIGNGAYDEAAMTFSGSEVSIPVPIRADAAGNGTTYLATPKAVRMRKSSDGRAISVLTNMAAQATFRRSKIVRTSSRSKLYFEGVTGTLSPKTRLMWSVEFETGAAGATSFGAELLSNGTFTTDTAGWTTNTHPGGGIAQNSGKMRFTRSASAEGRAFQAVATPVVGASRGVFLLAGEDTTSAGTLGSIGLTSNVNGSTATPAPAYTPVLDEAGYNAHVVQPVQDTSYFMTLQPQGTAAQTTDFDNLSMIKLAAAI